jgi:hypothetical protein
MKRIVPFLAGSAFSLILAASAFGQAADPGNSDKGAPATPPASSAPASPSAATPAPDAAAPAPSAPATGAPAVSETPAAAPASNPAIDRVKERGMKASEKERADVEKKLDDLEKEIETEATTKGDAAVTGRIGAEFGLTADALTAERTQYGRGYGELLVAHTLMANAGKTDVTMADLFTMRSQGMGWGAIAAGLDLKLGEVVSAVRSEQRVAMGLDKGDGKAATIHLASAASGKTKVAKASTKAPKGEVKGSAAGAGVGGGVDLNKGTGK